MLVEETLVFQGVFDGHSSCPWIVQPAREPHHMKRIEAVVRRSDLSSFYQCAEKLGIFGFDLSENRIPRAAGSHGRLCSKSTINPQPPSRLKVDFAVLDREAKDTVHAVLEQVHPDSIAIFELKETSSAGGESGDLRPEASGRPQNST
jgi:hypothetical protein